MANLSIFKISRVGSVNTYKELYDYNTAEISDVLDSCDVEGGLLGISSLFPGMKVVGPAFTVKYLPYDEKPEEFVGAGNYIDSVPPGSVILVDNQGREDCTTWGDILTQVALMKDIAGTVVNGAVRDVETIRELQYPVFSRSVYMRSGKNRVYKSVQQCNLFINDIYILPGDIIMGDDNGVVIVPQKLVTTVIEKAKKYKKNGRSHY